jgi:hypothetical protein
MSGGLTLDKWFKDEHWRLHSQYDEGQSEKGIARSKKQAEKEAEKVRKKGFRARVIKWSDWETVEYLVYFTLPSGTKRTPNDKYRLRDTSVEIEKAAVELGSEQAGG